jgi:lysyl-tRNA synthetase class 1
LASHLTPDQRGFLGSLADALEALPATEWVGEGIQSAIFSTTQERGLAASAGFGALYAAFLGRRSGPRAGWLLASLDRPFVVERLRAAGGAA